MAAATLSCSRTASASKWLAVVRRSRRTNSTPGATTEGRRHVAPLPACPKRALASRIVGVPSTSPAARDVALGGGIKVPYPEPRTAEATAIGKANKRTGTRCEIAIRSELHARGLRFRKDLLLRVGGIRVRPDIVFTKARVAVFVDGCFWHACPEHGRSPKSNKAYWGPKLQRNRDRDAEVNEVLRRAQWTVVRVWEHEDPAHAADEVLKLIRSLR